MDEGGLAASDEAASAPAEPVVEVFEEIEEMAGPVEDGDEHDDPEIIEAPGESELEEVEEAEEETEEEELTEEETEVSSRWRVPRLYCKHAHDSNSRVTLILPLRPHVPDTACHLPSSRNGWPTRLR